MLLPLQNGKLCFSIGDLPSHHHFDKRIERVTLYRQKLILVERPLSKGKPLGKPAIRLKYKAGVKVRTLGFRAFCEGRYAGQVGAFYTIWEEKAVEVYNTKPNG